MLTIKTIEAAKAGKHFDGQGLYLEVRPNGSKLWRLKYRHAGAEKRISFGAYPEVSLKEARLRTEDARRLLRDGIDPSAHRQAQRRSVGLDASLEYVAREWHAQWRRDKAATHHEPVMRRLELNVFPRLGRLPVADIEPVHILPVLRTVEARGAVETAHRIRSSLGMVFRYAVATGRCARDPTADLRGALAPTVGGHMAAITEPAAFGALLREIDGYAGQPSTTWALRLTPLLAVRPGELRNAKWEEVDLETATWTIPAGRMKQGRAHVVPLAKQAVVIFKEAQSLGTEGLIFPSIRSRLRPISDNTINAALRRLGYGHDEIVAHGFRASFRTLADEVLGERVDLIEHQLAHTVRDPLGRAYNRTEFLPERRALMQRWADWCDGVKRPAAA